MVNKEYKTVQVPKEAYDMLKQYCDENGYKLGRYLEKLIFAHCSVKKPTGKVLLVDASTDKLHI